MCKEIGQVQGHYFVCMASSACVCVHVVLSTAWVPDINLKLKEVKVLKNRHGLELEEKSMQGLRECWKMTQ